MSHRIPTIRERGQCKSAETHKKLARSKQDCLMCHPGTLHRKLPSGYLLIRMVSGYLKMLHPGDAIWTN